MSPRTLAVLVLLGAASLAGGWFFGTATEPREQVSVDAGKLMFPDLTAKLKDATKIEITSQGKTTEIVRSTGQDGEVWGLVDHGGYKVLDSKLRSMLTALTELRLVEPRTADPAQFARLGVEDPSAKDSKSNLLRVLDSAGKPMVSLIVGHRRVRTQGKVEEQVYVRRPGENQSWLAEGSLQVDTDPQLWLDRAIMNVPETQISGVVVRRADQTVILAGKEGKLTMTEPADHPPLDQYRLGDVARALDNLTFQDVQKDDAPDGQKVGAKIGQSVFTTTDGMTVTATVLQGDKENIWARFAVSGDGKAKDEAARLNRKVAGWSYQFGGWREKALVPLLSDLKAEEKKPADTSDKAPMSTPAMPSTAAPAGVGGLPPNVPPDLSTARMPSGPAGPGAGTPANGGTTPRAATSGSAVPGTTAPPGTAPDVPVDGKSAHPTAPGTTGTAPSAPNAKP